MSTILTVEGVSKKFQAYALQNITFNLQQGESLALVGANGAGKSTLIKIILGLVRPTQGSGKIYGYDFSDFRARQRVGYLPEMPGYWGEISAQDLLGFMGKIRRLEKPVVQRRSEKLLAALGLRLRGSRLMAGYSKGMLQRTGIAQTLLHDPDLIVLDEPMSGLDPRAQEKLKGILLNLRSKGKTLIISSHSLEDIRTLCSRVIVLEKSQIVQNGPTEEVLSKLVETYRSSEPWDEDPLGELPDVWT